MRLRQQLLVKNECYITGKTIRPKGVMVHSTGANNPRVARYVPGDDEIGRNTGGNHWNQLRPGGRQVCVHAFVGKFADGQAGVVQTLPWTMRGWHSGSGKKGSAQNTHIGFEICEDGLDDPGYFQAVYRDRYAVQGIRSGPAGRRCGDLPRRRPPAGDCLQPRGCPPLVAEIRQDYGRFPGRRGPGDERRG